MNPSAFRSLAFALTLTAGLCSGAEQPIQAEEFLNASIDIQSHTPPRVYQGQQIIQVIPTTQDQLAKALELAEGVWSERIGIGPIELQVDRESLNDFRALGLNPVVLIEDLQARADLDWQRVVRAHQLELSRPIDNNRGNSPHDENWFTNFRQLNAIHSYMNALASVRPDLAVVSSIGTSIEGRDIPAITITGPDAPGNLGSDRPVVLFNGCQHAREWVSPMTVTYIASRLVGDYDSDAEVQSLLDSARVVIVPVVNPDGYSYTWSNERFWRKNRRDIAGSSSFGVDLNRNWGYEWGGEGASSFPNDDIYHGDSPFSEPETTAMINKALELGDDLVAHIDYHSYSQLILWPFGYAEGVTTPEPDRTYYDSLSTSLSDTMLSVNGAFYDPIQSLELYPASGVATDWFYGELGASSITIELRPNTSDPGFDLPPEEILPTAHENWPAALQYIRSTTSPILFFSGDQPTVVDADQSTPVSLIITGSAAELDTSSPILHAQIGAGSEIQIPMTSSGPASFTADLPAAMCGEEISFRFSAQSSDSQTVEYPASGSFTALAELAIIVAEDDMESDTGWSVGAPSDTATTGVWERANPQATDAQPENDHSPIGTLCWITDAQAGSSIGANDIDGGATTLTSPALDATGFTGDAILSYSRWYSNNAGGAPNADEMQVLISNDNGANWETLETVTENAEAWVEKRFSIAEFVTPTDQMRVRFVASDFDEGSIVEAGVDDLQLIDVGCPETSNSADYDNNGILDIFDVLAFIDFFNASDALADFTDDGAFDIFDVLGFIEAFNAG